MKQAIANTFNLLIVLSGFRLIWWIGENPDVPFVVLCALGVVAGFAIGDRLAGFQGELL